MPLTNRSHHNATAVHRKRPLCAGDRTEQLARYLRRRAATGPFYCKSTFIADEVDLSPKEIGALMRKLSDADRPIEIEKWSNTRATTWRVELPESDRDAYA